MRKLIKPVSYVLILAVLGTYVGFGSPLFIALIIGLLVLALYLSYPTMVYTIGLLKYGKRNYEDALKWFDRADKTGRLKPKLRVNFAYYLIKIGEPVRAEEILRDMIGKKSTSFALLCQAKSNLAIVLSKTDRLDEGIRMIEDVYQEFKTTNVYGVYGYFLIQKGENEKALLINKEAYEYNNQNAVIADNLGLNYLLLGNLVEAERIYDALIDKKPTFIEAYYDAAMVKAKLAKEGEARELFNKALACPVNFLSNITHEEVHAELAKLPKETAEKNGEDK